jgi:hypothetical protein
MHSVVKHVIILAVIDKKKLVLFLLKANNLSLVLKNTHLIQYAIINTLNLISLS